MSDGIAVMDVHELYNLIVHFYKSLYTSEGATGMNMVLDSVTVKP